MRCFAIAALFWVSAGVHAQVAGPSPDADPEAEVRSARAEWTEAELRTLQSLSLAALRPPPFDASNRVADDASAADFGARLFFDPRLSRNGTVSCATCHQPQRFFTDGLARSRGLGETERGAPTLVGAAYAPWLFWDGRRDSLWSQALAPIEHPDEMGMPRVAALRVVAADPALREEYHRVFGGALPNLSDVPPEATPGGDAAARLAWQALPEVRQREIDRAFTNLGKAIAAYERKLIPQAARFDAWVLWLLVGDRVPRASLTESEKAGLRLFMSPRAQCLRCHNGPLLTNQGFHNVGTGRFGVPSDAGRARGVQEALEHEFRCQSELSDALALQCAEQRFAKREGAELWGAFKVPTLRNVAETAPYLHSGELATLDDVLRHYAAPTIGVGHMELSPAGFDAAERGLLEDFLRTLTASPPVDPRWLQPPPAPAGDR